MDSAMDFVVLSESPACPATGFAVNLSTVPAIPIPDEVMRSLSVGECFYDLLCRPSPGRMLGHIEMQHLATIVFQDDQYEQYPHGNCRHSKKINRYHLADMVAQEGAPGLVRAAE